MTSIDPAVRAQVLAALGDKYAESQLSMQEAERNRLLGFHQTDQEYKDEVQRISLGVNNAQLLARGKISSQQRKEAEKAKDRARSEASRKGSPTAGVAKLEQPVNPSGGQPANMNTADLTDVPVGSQGGGPQFIQEAKASGGDMPEAPAFKVAGNQTTETGPFRWTPYMTGPATTTRTGTSIVQNALDPGDVLRAKVLEGEAQRKQSNSSATLLGGTIGLMMLEDPAKAQEALQGIRAQYGDAVAERVTLEALKASSQARLQERRATMEDKLIRERQSEGRAESDAYARSRAGLNDALARARQEAKDERNPNRAIAAQKAKILEKVQQGGLDSLSQPEKDVLNATRPFNVLEWATRQAGQGAPLRPATDDDVSRNQGMFRAEHGHTPTLPELRDYMGKKGLSLP